MDLLQENKIGEGEKGGKDPISEQNSSVYLP